MISHFFPEDNLSQNSLGHLTFAGQDTTNLARQYGTPLYLYDECKIRQNCRLYREALSKAFGKENALPLYASKAASFKQIYRLMQEEEMGVDVVSCGEIYTAKSAGFDMSRSYFHGNNKTDDDIAYAMDAGVGCFVVDNVEELYQIDREAGLRHLLQKIMVRVTPGIDTHTYEAVNTGKVDSKFGCAIETGSAEHMLVEILKLQNVRLVGFHCHVGSQVFGEDVFERAAVKMLSFMNDMRQKHNFVAGILDLGGGFGVRYTEKDPVVSIPDKIQKIADVIRKYCADYAYPTPFVMLEPGRSIVANAGLALYTVGGIKQIPGYKTYVSVDGGMADNPRYALYRSVYTVYPADKMNTDCDMECSLVGRCCESGDILGEHVFLPADMQRGDLVAMATAGAYQYAMAGHYNRLPNPAVVMLNQENSYVAVLRETYEDVSAHDI